MVLERLISFLGLFALIFIAWCLSSNRQRFPWRIVIGGLFLQFAIALLTIKTYWGRELFARANDLVTKISDFSKIGAGSVFGVNSLPSAESATTPGLQRLMLLETFAFGVLPTIIFFSALMSVLYHLGIMQLVVRAIAWLMQRTLRTSGPETLSAAANIFVGQTEAPLVIKPYLNSMTRSELNALMVGGFATISGSLLVAFVRMGVDAGHLLTACVISAPAALLIAKVMLPETEDADGNSSVSLADGDSTATKSDSELTSLDREKRDSNTSVQSIKKTASASRLDLPKTSPNVIGAASHGASEGLQLALNVGAMLIAFLALIAMLDWVVGGVGILFGFVQDGQPTLSLTIILGYLFAPVAFILGVETKDCVAAGRLLGIKMVGNEFIAFQQLGDLLSMPEQPISERTKTIMTYALAGFANFGAIGIQVGGIGGLAPERKSEIARLGLRAMIGGTIACNMTACVAGLLL